MQMEDLTKTQVVLLTLFVSFVTSIATGIVTVTLMEQVPQSVTQTINRVVERTVERIVPGETKIREVPIVTTGEDQVVSAIAQAAPSLVRVYAGTGTTTPELELVGTGFFITGTGIIATAAHRMDAAAPLDIMLPGGELFSAKTVAVDNESGVALLQVSTTSVIMKAFPAIPLSAAPVGLGKTAIALIPGEPAVVALGIVSSAREGSASTSPLLATTIALQANQYGAPVIDSGGFVIGMMTGARTSVHVASVRHLLDALQKNR